MVRANKAFYACSNAFRSKHSNVITTVLATMLFYRPLVSQSKPSSKEQNTSAVIRPSENNSHQNEVNRFDMKSGFAEELRRKMEKIKHVIVKHIFIGCLAVHF